MSLSAIGIVARDIPKSLAFYTRLGLQFKQFQLAEHFDAIMESGVSLMLDSESSIKEMYPDWIRPTGSSGVVLCFKQSSPKEVDELFHRLTNSGAQVMKAPWDAFWGQRYASVFDPDGNQIDLFASL